MDQITLHRHLLTLAILLSLSITGAIAADIELRAPPDGNVITTSPGGSTLLKVDGAGPVTIPAGMLGVGTTTPNASALVDFSSTSKGFLPPRMTQVQRVAIAAPATGLIVYQTDGTAGLYQYNGSAWVVVGGGGSGTVTSIGVSGGNTGLTTSGGPVTTNGTVTLSGTLNVASGGTGSTTASAALTALLPTQTGNSGKVLSTDGTTATWTVVGGGTVTSIATGTGLTGGTITSTGTVSLADTAVTAGSYTNANITVDAQGRLTAAANGTTSGGTVTSVALAGGTTGLTTSGGPITGSGTITLGGTLALANGGTGATTAATARSGLGAASSGSNTDITSLTGLNQQAAVKVGPYGTNAGNTGEVRFSELAANGTHHMALKAPDLLAADVTLTLPDSAGTSGQVLSTDGSGELSWISAGGTGTVTTVTGTAPISVATGTSTPVVSIAPATTSAAGSMSATDKAKLDAFGASSTYASSGANSNITSLTGLTTPLTVAQGGTGLTSVGTSGQVLTSNGTGMAWNTISGSGTVTSVALAGGTTGLTTSGGPITGSGTITLGGTLAVANGGTGAGTAAGARTNLELGTAATQNTGTAANNVVALDSNAKLPAVDGSLLTGVVGSVISDSGANTKGGTSAGGTSQGSHYNTAFGNFALANTTSDLQNNTAIGASALRNLSSSGSTQGVENIGVGYRAGQSLTTGSYNIAIGNLGVAADSHTTRLGTPYVGGVFPTGQQRAFIAGIRGVSPAGSSTQTVIIDENGQLGSTASGSGTVTSVDVSGGTTGLTTSGGAVTSSGTITLGGTLAVANGGTGTTTAPTPGGVIFAASGSAYASTAAGTAGQVLTSNGSSAPTWATASTTMATNLAGGSAGTLPYQSSSGTTAMLAAGTSGQALLSGGAAAPTWGTLGVAAGGTGTTNGSITGTGALTFAAGGSNQNVTLTPSGTGVVSIAGPATFTGTVTEAVGSTGRVQIGNASSTNPRIQLIGGSPLSMWQIDHDGANLRFYQPGVVKATLNTSGGLSLLGGLTAGADSSITGNLTLSAGKSLVLTGSGSNTATITAPSSGTTTLTLPSSAGTSGQVLTTNGSGALSWSTVAASGANSNITSMTNLTGEITFPSPTTNKQGISWGTAASRIYDDADLHVYTDDKTYFDAYSATPLWTWSRSATSTATGTALMTLNETGLGVLGTLNVSGAAAGTAGTYTILGRGGVDTNWSSTPTNSITAAQAIQAAYFVSTSDARIKQSAGVKDSREALDAVNRLKITDYTYIDKPVHGDRRRTGVLAQEAEQVFPDAVRKGKDFIPDIFAMADAVRHDASLARLTITLPKPHGLKVGDKVRYSGKVGTHDKAVVAIDGSQTFTLADVTQAETEVFVVGHEVDDFRTVNYEDLFSTGLAAIQELSKRNESLRAAVDTQQAEIDELRAQMAAVLAKLPQ